jgi:predicted nucleotidyltransferase component of viral defense system
MVDLNKHKFFLLQILKDIYTDIEIAPFLGFKGGTALMFFYDLPRFSIDLDFNLLDTGKEKQVYEKVRTILLKYGVIHDEAMKFYGPVIVLNYGYGERNLKVEISNRQWNDRYEIKNLLGIEMKVMAAPYMFAHKLCTLLDRSEVASRDIFDSWFFLQRRTPLSKSTVENRMQMPLDQYLQKCIDLIETIQDRKLLFGLGELMDDEMKKFVRTKLRSETISLLRLYKEYPLLSE